MTPAERADLRAESFRTDAIEELENDDRLELHERGEHDETRDRLCASCEDELAEAFEEYRWMGQAVKSWTGGNPYSNKNDERDGWPEFNGSFR